MILLTFQTPEGLKLGVKTEKGILEIQHFTPITFFKAGLTALADIANQTSGTYHDAASLTLGPCVPTPGKILCVGLNYRKHAEESGAKIPETPVLFSKFNNAIAAANETIPLPSNAEQHDYEAELVVVIGKTARNVNEAEALDYVLGYCNGNDISTRDLQMRTSQWLLGKTLDKFLPIGPYLFTADEVSNPQDLPIQCWLNGELRQHSNTADMIFTIAQIISYTSQYFTLEAGDIISTGTPEGVILGMKEKVWMKPGDEVTVEVGHLGRLTNTMGKG